MREKQELLIRLFAVLRNKQLVKEFSDIMPDDFTMDDFTEGIERLTAELEKKDRSRTIKFHDENEWVISKFNIKTFVKSESVEGDACIILNEFLPDDARGGIGERTLYYESEELRDQDYEKLCFMLS